MRRWRAIALVAAGLAIGVAMMATPAASHVGGTVGHLWNDHIKPRADARYANAVAGTDKARDADKVDGKHAGDLVAAGAFVTRNSTTGALSIHHWFNNVNGTAPTIAKLFDGYYQLDFGFDARGRHAVCSIDPNFVDTRNANCGAGTRWFATSANSKVDVTIWDPEGGSQPAEFNLLVY
jgi:hypothetical protein